MESELKPLRVSVIEAAAMLGISRAQLYKHISAGKLTPQREGARVLFPVKELERFVAAGGAGGSA